MGPGLGKRLPYAQVGIAADFAAARLPHRIRDMRSSCTRRRQGHSSTFPIEDREAETSSEIGSPPSYSQQNTNTSECWVGVRFEERVHCSKIGPSNVLFHGYLAVHQSKCAVLQCLFPSEHLVLGAASSRGQLKIAHNTQKTSSNKISSACPNGTRTVS